jgi:hypothetical protein
MPWPYPLLAAPFCSPVRANSDVDAQVLREGGVVLGETVQRGRDRLANSDSSPFCVVGRRPGPPDEGPNGDQQLIARLFSPAARADPYPLYQDAPLPGCRHAVASRMLKDPRLGPPMLGLETANELMWRTFARWRRGRNAVSGRTRRGPRRDCR